MALNSLLFRFLLLSCVASKLAFCELELEFGHTVSTVLHGDKLGNPINPYAILPRPQDVLLLDSVNSALYTLSLPISQDSKINRIAGNGVAGFSDGDSTTSAMFDHPKSFAMDPKGNVYVADQNNHAIRKVGMSGVTTIAGGYSKKIGNTDGPAQNASFSPDFDLVFVPKLCALLISDRGNRLIRQINLEPAVCARESQSGLGMGSVSLIGVFCLLLGLVAGFAVRPLVTSYEFSGSRNVNKTWKHCQTHLGKRVLILCSDIKSAIASSVLYTLLTKIVGLLLYQLSLMFRVRRLTNQCSSKEPISLLDLDVPSNRYTTKSQVFTNQLKDLISFNEGSDVVETNSCECGKIDDLIQANISNFGNRATQEGQLEGFSVGGSGLVKRRSIGLNGQ